MASIRELVVTWGFDIDSAPLDALDDNIQRLQDGLIAVGAAAIAAAGSLFGIAQATANAADNIVDASNALGINTDALQKLGYAASQSGADQEMLNDALKFLSKNAVDAGDKTSAAAKSFSRLGVSARDSNGRLKSSEQLMLEMSDAFKKMPAGVEKTSLSMEVFGRAGSRMIQFLNNGSEGIAALGKEAEELGLIMGADALEAGAAFNDEIDRIKGIAKGLMLTLGSGLIPIIHELAVTFRGWVIENRELIRTRIQSFIEVLSKFLEILWRAVRNVYLVFAKLHELLQPHTRTINALSMALKGMLIAMGLIAIGRTAQTIWGLSKGFAELGAKALLAWKKVFLGPLLWGAAIAAIYLIVDDVIGWLEGRPSFLGWVIANKEQIWGKVVAWFQRFKAKTMEVLGISSAAFDFWSFTIQAIISGLITFFTTKAVVRWTQALAKMATDAWAAGTKIFNSVTSWAQSVGKGIAKAWELGVQMASSAKKAALWAAAQIRAGVVAAASWTKTAVIWIAGQARMAAAAVASAATTAAAWVAKMAVIVAAHVAMGAKAAAAWLVAIWPVALVIAALVAVGVAVWQVVKHWDTIKETFSQLWNAFLAVMGRLWDGLKSGAATAWSSVSNAAASAWEAVKSAWSGAVSWYAGMWTSIIDGAIGIGIRLKDALVRPVVDAFTSMFSWLRESLAGIPGISIGATLGKVTPPGGIAAGGTVNPFAGITPGATVSAPNSTSSTEVQSTINVTVPPGSDAQSIGEAVRVAAADEFARLLRPAARAVTPSVSY